MKPRLSTVSQKARVPAHGGQGTRPQAMGSPGWPMPARKSVGTLVPGLASTSMIGGTYSSTRFFCQSWRTG